MEFRFRKFITQNCNPILQENKEKRFETSQANHPSARSL